MKYIVTKQDDGMEEIFIFPECVPHNIMAESISHMRDQSWGSWKRVNRESISAGFVRWGKCTGESESLSLKSRPVEDTQLLPYIDPEN